MAADEDDNSVRPTSPIHRHGKFGLKLPIPDVLVEQPVRKKSTQFFVDGASYISKWRIRLHVVITSHRFTCFIGALISLNTVCMGLELDQHDMASHSEYAFSISGPQGISQAFFDGSEAFFLIAFGLEFIIRAFVFRSQLVWEVATYVDLVALMPAIALLAFGLQSGRQLTLLRIVRLVKLFRLLRIFRLSKELHMLAKSMASAMRALVWIALLLFITVYCSAVVCTTVIGHNSDFADSDPIILSYEAETGINVNARRYWGSMMRSMLTLFQIFTLDDWHGVVRPIVETHQPWMLGFFICFIFATTFGLLNLLMGTIVDRAMHIAKEYEEEKERLVQCEQKQTLLATVRLFSLMDEDGNGVLSAREIMAFLDSNDIQKALEREMSHFHIKLDYVSLTEICRRIATEWFDASSPDSDGITVEEFAGAAARLHGLARSQDMLTVLMTSKASLTRVEVCESGLEKLREASMRQEAKMDRVLDVLSQMNSGNGCPEVKPPKERPVRRSSVARQSSDTELSDTTCSLQEAFDPESPRSSPPPLTPHRRVASEPVLPVMMDAKESQWCKFRHSYAGAVPTLRLERGSFQRAGTGKIKGLLKDLKSFDEFFRTETATAIREYSSRSRPFERARTAGEEKPSQLEPVSSDNDSTGRRKRRVSDSDTLLYGKSPASVKNGAWLGRSQTDKSKLLNHDATSEKNKFDGISDSCTSILPCAIPFGQTL